MLDPRASALVLWDLQNGLAGQSPRVGELSLIWRRLLAVARAHDVLIVRSRHLSASSDLMPPVERWRISRRTHGENRPEHFMQPGGADTAWISGFEPEPDELVIEKSTPSLFHATAADARLRARGVQTLVMAGVATEIGIDFTGRHAMALGYFPVVVEDGVGSFTSAAHDHGMAILRSFAFVVTAAELESIWIDRTSVARAVGRAPLGR